MDYESIKFDKKKMVNVYCVDKRKIWKCFLQFNVANLHEKIGDQLITKTAAGTFTYVINLTRIVHKDDKSVIVPTDHAVLTVTTCYPFYYVGDAPDRYIITADLFKKEK